jgi:hypothetical protein
VLELGRGPDGQRQQVRVAAGRAYGGRQALRLAPKNDPPLTFPVRGVPGGYRDIWDDPNDGAQLRARAEATDQRLMIEAAQTATALRAEQDEATMTLVGKTPVIS